MSGKPKTPQVSKVTIEAKAFHDLQQAEAKYRSTFENAAEGIFQSTPGGRYLSVNPAMARIYGYETPEEMMEAIADIAHQIYADPEMRGEFSRRLKKEGKVERFELRALRKDGSLIWTSTNARIVRDAKGKVLFYEGFVQDITERKQAEEQIAYQAQLLAIVNDAVVASDAQYRLTAWNAAAESMYGWKAEEVLGRFGLDITRTEFPGVDKAEMLRAIAEGGSWRGEATQARKDGTRIPVEVSSMVLRDESGQITGYVSVNRDITERKRAEEEIKSLAKFPSENPNPILRIDQEGILLYANQAAFLLLADWNLQTGQAVPEVLRELMRETFVDQRVQTADIPCGERVFSVAAAPITETGYINLYIQNITERKRAEEALLFTRFSLDNAVETMACVDHDAHFIDVNNAFCRVSGHSREELLSMTVHDIDPDYSAEIWPAFWNKLKQSGSLTFESYHRSKEGRIYPVEITATYFEYNGKEYHCSFARDITERKHAEETLREAEAWFRTTLYSIGDAVITTDAKSRVQQMNPVAEALTGWREAEARGKPLAEVFYIVNQETRRAVENPVTRVLREGVVIGLGNHTLLIARDGTERPIADAGAPIRNDRGETVGVVLVFRDQTAERAAQKALRESEARFRIALENSPIVVFNQDQELRYTWVYNPHPGFDPQALLGKTDAELLPADDAARLAEIKRRVLETGVTAREEVKTTIGGQAFFYDLTVEPLRDLSGNIIGVTCASLDTTERKRAEDALRESEGRFRLLYEKAPLGYQSLDAAGCFIDVNQAWLDTQGYSRKEVIGRWFGDFLAPHEVEAFKQRFAKFKATGEIKVEVEMVRKDGAHAIIAIVGRIAYDEHGGFKQTHCILTDITERKRAEDALRESRARLARLSRRLVDAQEQERRRIARELHDEVGQNLTALTISLDGVSQLALDGVMRGKITEIQELTKNLIAEVNALSVELRPRVLDDLGLIPGLLSLFSRFSTQTGVEIDFKHTGIERKRLAPEIEISAYRIIQEALTNVVRHADIKTASVRLQVEGDILYIQVQDEGKGFDLQKAMKAEDSMGLLSMVERAEQIGGHLEVETAPGEGATITCRLPLGGSHIE